jgi:hypothetical protein
VNAANAIGFRFQIKPTEGGWSWAAIDGSGQVRAEGQAPTKAIAAAFVIRTIALASAPTAQA